MKRLNKYEEARILNAICKNRAENKFLDSGSSRAVYSYQDKYVVKVAYDIQGQKQNENEVDFFINHPDLCAEIFAYGKYIVVAEKVEVCLDVDAGIISEEFSWAFGDISEGYTTPEKVLREYEFDDFDGNEEEAEKVMEVMVKITDILGGTQDNEQIGYSTKRQKYVAYDYGFNTEEETEAQVGDIDAAIDAYGLYEMCGVLADRIKKGVKNRRIERFRHCKFNRVWC